MNSANGESSDEARDASGGRARRGESTDRRAASFPAWLTVPDHHLPAAKRSYLEPVPRSNAL